MRPYSALSSLFVAVSILLSCQKQKTPPPTRTEVLPYAADLSLLDFLPELAASSSIRYYERLGYCLWLGQQSGTTVVSVDKAFIPAQDFPFSVSVPPIAPSSTQFAPLNIARTFVLKGVSLPGGDACDHLDFSSCPSHIKVKIALGKDSPYSKVTLTDFFLYFRTGISAECSTGYGHYLEVTQEGVELTYDITTISSPVQSFDEQGRRCFHERAVIQANVSVSPEDAVGSAPGDSPVDFEFTFSFEELKLHSMNLVYKEPLVFPARTVKGGPVSLPSFLTTEGTDVSLPQPEIQVAIESDFANYAIPVVCTASTGFGQTQFTLPSGWEYRLRPHFDDPSIYDKEVPALDTLMHFPVPDQALMPSVTFQPVAKGEVHFISGQSYSLSFTYNWLVPLAFTGHLAVEGIKTPPLELTGSRKKAPGNSRHQIRQALISTLPFDCHIQPVFTMEGESPVLLDDFVVKAHGSQQRLFSYRFIPSSNDWKATLQYIVTPTEGHNSYFLKEGCLIVSDTELTLNMN